MGGCTSKPRREEEEVEEGVGRATIQQAPEARGPTNWEEVERANQQANLK